MGPGGPANHDPSTLDKKEAFWIGGCKLSQRPPRGGETVVKIEKRKRRQEIAPFLQMLLDKHPEKTVYVAWDNVNTHYGVEIEQVVAHAQGRLQLLYLPTYSPWLNGTGHPA